MAYNLEKVVKGLKITAVVVGIALAATIGFSQGRFYEIDKQRRKEIAECSFPEVAEKADLGFFDRVGETWKLIEYNKRPYKFENCTLEELKGYQKVCSHFGGGETCWYKHQEGD